MKHVTVSQSQVSSMFMRYSASSEKVRLRELRCIVALQVQIQPTTLWVILLLSPSSGCCLIKQKCAEKDEHALKQVK